VAAIGVKSRKLIPWHNVSLTMRMPNCYDPQSSRRIDVTRGSRFYFLVFAACFAATIARPFCFVAAALACFCAACFCVAFGGGKKQVSMFEMTKLVSGHVK
jgi:hypothetical protein